MVRAAACRVNSCGTFGGNAQRGQAWGAFVVVLSRCERRTRERAERGTLFGHLILCRG
jgi:hypothetical protein